MLFTLSYYVQKRPQQQTIGYFPATNPLLIRNDVGSDLTNVKDMLFIIVEYYDKI